MATFSELQPDEIGKENLYNRSRREFFSKAPSRIISTAKVQIRLNVHRHGMLVNDKLSYPRSLSEGLTQNVLKTQVALVQDQRTKVFTEQCSGVQVFTEHCSGPRL